MIRIIQGDCRAVLPALEAESVHCCVTDPPYHLSSIVKRFGAGAPAHTKTAKDIAARATPIGRLAGGFMNQQWDGGRVAFEPETWVAVLRVMKPGAYLTAFASTRGYHRMVCAIEDSGFIIHPMLGWLFGSGFPKATRYKLPGMEDFRYGLQALKPALEPICLAQKPMVGTGNENWLKYECGGLNINACRVAFEGNDTTSSAGSVGSGLGRGTYVGPAFNRTVGGIVAPPHDLGRWPPNLLHDGSPEVLEAFGAFGESVSSGGSGDASKKTALSGDVFGKYSGETLGQNAGGLGDSGTPARYFPTLPLTEEDLSFHYSAKAGAADRAGSRHPTVKPVALMRWLCRLVCPPGGTVLDPFMGTGSTLVAADQLQFNAIGIEADPQYVADARRKYERDAGIFADLQ